MDRHQPGPLLIARRERRIRHLQRPEQVLLQVGGEILSTERLDHLTEPVGVDAVVPRRARVGEQRHVQPGAQTGERLRDARHLVVVEEIRGEEAVAQAGRVGEQVPDRRRLPLRTQPGGVAVESLQHPQLSKGRQYRGDLLIQRQLPALKQLERGNARERLGHRHEPEQRFWSHRRIAADPQRPGGLLHALAVGAGHPDGRAGQHPVRHRRLQHLFNGRRPCARHRLPLPSMSLAPPRGPRSGPVRHPTVKRWPGQALAQEGESGPKRIMHSGPQPVRVGAQTYRCCGRGFPGPLPPKPRTLFPTRRCARAHDLG